MPQIMHKIPLIVYFEQMRNAYLITRNFRFEQTLTAYRTHLCEDLLHKKLLAEYIFLKNIVHLKAFGGKCKQMDLSKYTFLLLDYEKIFDVRKFSKNCRKTSH